MNDRDRLLKLIEQQHQILSREYLCWMDCNELIEEYEAFLGRLYSRRNRTLIDETKAILERKP